MRTFFRSLTAVLALTVTSDAFAVGAGGIANEITSSEHLSGLLAVAGSKSDPTVTYNNPASISLLEPGFRVAAGGSYLTLSAERTGSTGSDKMDTTKAFIPHFGAAGRVTEKLGIGFALLSPYGLETDWGEASNVRYVATESTLKMFDATLAVSYRAFKSLSLGLGLDYFSTFDADLQKKVPVDVINTLIGFPTAGAPDANSRLSGDGDQWGYHAGILVTPGRHSFGVTYHSEVKTKIEGDLELNNLSGASQAVFGGADFKTPVRTDLFYPQQVQFGYKYSVDEKWEAGANLAWYDWSSNKQLEIVLPNANATQRALLGAPIPLDWRDVWSATVGGMYRFNEGLALRCGAYYLPAAYPEQTFSPAVPDLDKIGLSVGPAITRGNLNLDLVYSPIFYRKTTINNQVGQNATGLATADISGEYKGMVHIFGVTLTYAFN